MYTKASLITLAAWLTGLFLDANLKWKPAGSLNLTVLFPILAMGLCILKAIQDNKQQRD